MSEILRVEFGAGGTITPGWRSHDIEVPIDRPLPYEDGTVHEIKAEHVVEHVSPAAALGFFDECLRILVPGGKLRISVPSITQILTRSMDDDGARLAHARDIVVGHGHQAVYDHAVLMALLRIAGFPQIYAVPRDLTLDGHWHVIGLAKDELETIRVEARKAS